MNFDDWFQWPTKSTDPGVNFVVLIVLFLLAGIALAAGAFIVIPVLIIIGIAKGAHWYANRPMPTDQLIAQTEQRTVTANFPTQEQFLEAHVKRLFDAFEERLPAYHVYLTMAHISEALYQAEDLNNPLPPIPAGNTIEEGRYRDRLLTRMRKTADAPKTLEVINTTLGTAYLRFIDSLPRLAKATPEDFAEADEKQPLATFPLIDLLPHPGSAIVQLIAPFFSEDVDQLGLFANLKRQFERNAHQASGIPYPAPSDKLVMPEAYKGTSQEAVSAYLGNTPLEALFYAPIPFSFADEQRFEHMHIVGGSGHGKTQLLQHLILNDLQKDNPPALVVIDSQGDMLRKLQRLAIFEKSPDRLVIIDPEDDASPALNMFDTTNARLSGYSRNVREQIEAGVIELYNYVFGALAAELTQKQGTAFAFVTRLMLSIPGATIHTLRELMEDTGRRFDAHIAKLDPTAQAFFQNQFYTKSFDQTRQQIARRLYGVLQVPAFDRMFSSQQNRLDLFQAIQSGKVVLINTSKALLKEQASALFGRYMIALTMKAAFERVAVPMDERRPAFLFVDEAAEYFDENVETLLEQARKFQLGVVLAHQSLHQLGTSLQASVAANTSIKLAGGVSDRDARSLAPDMRTTADFITSMKKHERSTEFSCYVRNVTDHAIRLEIPFGTVEAAPAMSEAAHRKLIESNRERYAYKAEPQKPAPQTPPEKPAETPTAAAEVASTDPATKW